MIIINSRLGLYVVSLYLDEAAEMIQLCLFGQNASPRQLIVVDIQPDHIRLGQRRDVTRWSADATANVLQSVKRAANESLVLCEYSTFRIESNSYFSIRFETSAIVRNFRILTVTNLLLI